MTPEWQEIIRQSGDLTTPHAKTREGFVALALEKSKQANPYIEQARHLMSLTRQCSSFRDLWSVKDIRPALMAASGLSDKAAGHLTEDSRRDVFHQFADEFLAPAGDAFSEELVYRFLLTKGDSLGGKMRNIGGKIAKRRLNRAILAMANLAGLECSVSPEDCECMEDKIKCIGWRTGQRQRALVQDIKLPTSNTNVDLCLLDAPAGAWEESIGDHKRYVALGELKGGFDPAGADERWKTARTAFSRLRSSIRPCPPLFFVGAAIEAKMADEIFTQLKSGELQFVANLTNDDQVAALCRWLVNL